MRFRLLTLIVALLLLVPGVLHAQEDTTLNTYEFVDLPVLGTTDAGQEILLGGFSGLFLEGTDENGRLIFVTHPDRGPNAEPLPVFIQGEEVMGRPFPLPEYQPRIVRFALNQADESIEILETIPLFRENGETPLTGLPNMEGPAGMAYADEAPVDLNGNVLRYDPYGADLEGIVIAEDGSFWMVDEYRPSIYHFAPDGVMINRYVPEGSSTTVDTGIEAIPAVYAQRRANRGFEAVALDGNKLYAFVQSPLDVPDVADDASSKAGIGVRIVEFDIETAMTTGEYFYLIEGGPSDKIGDAAALGNGEFLVIERDSAVGDEAIKNVFRINLDGATNLLDVEVEPESFGTVFEMEAAGITPVQKELYVDLVAAGYRGGDKPEGLAVIDENTIAVLNDNDFRLAGGVDLQAGLLADNPTPFAPILGVITVNE